MKSLLNLLVRGLSYLNLDSAPSGLRLGSLGSLGGKLGLDLSLSALNLDYLNLNYLNNLNLNYFGSSSSSSSSSSTSSSTSSSYLNPLAPSAIFVTITDLDVYNENAFGMLPYNVAQSSPYTFLSLLDNHRLVDTEEIEAAALAARAKINAMLDDLELDVACLNDTATATATVTTTSLVSGYVSEFESVSEFELESLSVSELASASAFESASESASTPVSKSTSATISPLSHFPSNTDTALKHKHSHQHQHSHDPNTWPHPLLFSPAHIHPRLLHLPAYLPPGTPRPLAPFTVVILDLDLNAARSLNWMRSGTAGKAVYVVTYWHPVRDIGVNFDSERIRIRIRESKLSRALAQRELYFLIMCVMGGIYVVTIGAVIMIVRCKYGYDLKYDLEFERQTRLWKTHLVSLPTRLLSSLLHTLTPLFLHRLITHLLTTYHLLTRLQLILHTDSDTSTPGEAILLYIGYIHRSRSGLIQSLWVKKLVICLVPYPWIVYMEDARRVFCEAMMSGRRGVRMGGDEDESSSHVSESTRVADDLDAERTLVDVIDAEKTSNTTALVDEKTESEPESDTRAAISAAKKAIALKLVILAWSKTVTLPLAPTPTLPRTRSLSEEHEDARLVNGDVDGDGHDIEIEGGKTDSRDDEKDSFVSNTPTPSNTPINTPSNNESTDDEPAPVHSLSHSHSLHYHPSHNTIDNDNNTNTDSHEDEATSSPRRGAVSASGSFTLTLSGENSGERGISGNDGTMGGAIVGLVGLDDTSTTVTDDGWVGICSETEESDGSGIGLVKPEEDQIEDEATLSFAEESLTLVVEDDGDVNTTNPDEQKILLDGVACTSTKDDDYKIRSTTRSARSDAKARGLQVILYNRSIEDAIWYPNTNTNTTRPSKSKDAAIDNTRTRVDLRVISFDRLGCVRNMTSYTTTLNLMNDAIENIQTRTRMQTRTRTQTRTWRESELRVILYDKSIENMIWHPNRSNDIHTHTRITHTTRTTTPRTTIPSTPMHEPHHYTISNSRTAPQDLPLGFDLFGFPSCFFTSISFILPFPVPTYAPPLAPASALTRTNTNTNTNTNTSTITNTPKNTITTISAPLHEEETKDDNNDVYSNNNTYAETRMVLYVPKHEPESSSSFSSPTPPPLGTPLLPLPLSIPIKVALTPSPINHTNTDLHTNTQDRLYDNAPPPSVHVQPDEPKAHTSPLAAPIVVSVSESSASSESKSEEAKILLPVETESVPFEDVDVDVVEYVEEVDVVGDADTKSDVPDGKERGTSSSEDGCVESELEILISERDLSHDACHSSKDMTMMNTSVYHDATPEIRGDGEGDGDTDVKVHVVDDVEGLKSGAVPEAKDEVESTSSVSQVFERAREKEKEKEITISTPESACTLLELELNSDFDTHSDAYLDSDLAFSSECKIIVRLPVTSANTTKASRGATTRAVMDVGSSEGCLIPDVHSGACAVNIDEEEVVVGNTGSKEVDTIAKASTISRTPSSFDSTTTCTFSLPEERSSILMPTSFILSSPKVVTEDQPSPVLLPSKASVTSTTSESVSSPTLLCSSHALTKCDISTPPNLLEKECTLFGTGKAGTVDCVDTSVVAMPLFTCDVTKTEDLVSDSRDLNDAVNVLEVSREQDSICYTRFGSSETQQTSTTTSHLPSDPSEPTPTPPLFFEDYTGSPTPSSSTNPIDHTTQTTPNASNSIYSTSALTAAGLVQSSDGSYLVPTTSREDGSQRLERKIRPGFLPLDLESRLKYPTGRRLSPNRDVLLRHLQANNDSDVGTRTALSSRRSASPKERTKEVVGSGGSVGINVVHVPEAPSVLPKPSGKSVNEDPDEAYFRSLGGTSASMWAPWNLASNPYAEEYAGDKASVSPPSATQPTPHLQANEIATASASASASHPSAARIEDKVKEAACSGSSTKKVAHPEPPPAKPPRKSSVFESDEAYFRSLGGTSASMWAPWNLASNPYAEEYVGNKASISPPSASPPAPHLQANETATTITSQQLATASEDKSKNNVSSVDTIVGLPDSRPQTVKPRIKPSDLESDEAYFRSLGGTSASMWAPWNLASNPYAEEYTGNKGSTCTTSASPSTQRPQANITATASASASRQSAVVTEDKIKEAASNEPSTKNVALPDMSREKSVDSDPDEAFFRSLGGTSASMWAPWNLASNPYAEEYAGNKGSITASGTSPSVQPQSNISATEDKIKRSVTASSASSSAQRLKASEIANASVSHQPSMATEDKTVNTVSDESLAKKVVHPESRPQPAKPHATDHESDEAYFRSLGGTSASMWAPWNLASNPYAKEYTGNKESKCSASTSPPTQPIQANKTETTTVLHRSAEAPADKVESTIPSGSSVEKVVHPEPRPPISKPCGKSTDYESDEAYFRSLGGTSASMWAPWNLSSNPYAEEYTGDKRPSSASPTAHHPPACKTENAPVLHRPAEASEDKSKNIVSSVSTVKEVTHPEPRPLPAKPSRKPMDYESDEAYFRSLGGTSASMWAPWNLSSNPYAEEYTGDKGSIRQPSPSVPHLRAKEAVTSYQPAVITESKTMNTVSSETSAKKVAHPEPRSLPAKPRPKPMDYESDEAYFRSLGGTSASMWAPWNLASNPYAEEYTGNKGSISASNASSSSQHCQASETATISVSRRLAAAAEGETKETVSRDSLAENVMQPATSTPLLLKSCSKTVNSDSNNAIFRSLGDASASTRGPCIRAKLDNNDNGSTCRSIPSSSTISTPGHTFDGGRKHRGAMNSVPQTMNTTAQLLPSVKSVRRPTSGLSASMRVPSPLSSRPNDKENIPGVSQNPVKNNGVSTRPWRLL